MCGHGSIRNVKPLPNTSNITSKKSSDTVKLTKTKASPKPQRPIEQPLPNITDFDPQHNGYEPSDAELFKSDDPYPEDFFGDILPSDLPKVSNSVNTEPLNLPQPSILREPNSRKSLHRNLLYLINVTKPSPRLPALVDYHAHYSEWQSTASYNLLISLAIRHQSYGISRRLINDHSLSNLPKNLDTYKLEVRNLVHQGLWNKAWKYVQNLRETGRLPLPESGEMDIPFPIWLEFFRPVKRPRIRKRLLYDTEGKLVDRFFEEVIANPEEMKAYQGLLNQNRPRNMPPLSHTPPHAIYCIVQLLMKSGNKDRALKLTKAFFGAISRSLSHTNMRWCLDIIHAHMLSCSAKDGLPRFYEARRTLVALLSLHRSLHPNSKTLYLLLAPLQRAKHCGTKAWKQLSKFKSEWGPFVEDRRVQRRVANLALKEGRMDIVKKIARAERTERRYRQRRLSEDQMTQRIRRVRSRACQVRLPFRLVYPKNGREARLWYRLRVRIRKVYQRKQRRRRRLQTPREMNTFTSSP